MPVDESHMEQFGQQTKLSLTHFPFCNVYPVSHWVHCVSDVQEVQFCEQEEHDVTAPLEYVPAGQVTQLVPALAYVPAGQVEQYVAPAEEIVPFGQDVQ